MLFVNYCIIKQFQMATYTKYNTSCSQDLSTCAVRSTGFQNSVIPLTNTNITKTTCSPCYSDCTQCTALLNENDKQCILLASGPTIYTRHHSTSRPLHTYQTLQETLTYAHAVKGIWNVVSDLSSQAFDQVISIMFPWNITVHSRPCPRNCVSWTKNLEPKFYIFW